MEGLPTSAPTPGVRLRWSGMGAYYPVKERFRRGRLFDTRAGGLGIMGTDAGFKIYFQGGNVDVDTGGADGDRRTEETLYWAPTADFTVCRSSVLKARSAHAWRVSAARHHGARGWGEVLGAAGWTACT